MAELASAPPCRGGAKSDCIRVCTAGGLSRCFLPVRGLQGLPEGGGVFWCLSGPGAQEGGTRVHEAAPLSLLSPRRLPVLRTDPRACLGGPD